MYMIQPYTYKYMNTYIYIIYIHNCYLIHIYTHKDLIHIHIPYVHIYIIYINTHKDLIHIHIPYVHIYIIYINTHKDFFQTYTHTN